MKSKHFLYSRNPYGEDFPRYVDSLISKLIEGIGFERDKLDFSLNSLEYIDLFLLENDILIDDSFIEENLLGFIAYLGEGFIRRNGGEWKMVIGEDGETWEPHIISHNGKDNFKYALYIYKTLLEDYPSSLYSCSMFDI